MKKAFFGKTTCLKIQFNEGNTYFHMGKTEDEKNWSWEKLKMSDIELGEIIRVLEGKKNSWNTVHVFNENKSTIHMNRSNEVVFVKINGINKSLSAGEQEVLCTLLRELIVKMNS